MDDHTCTGPVCPATYRHAQQGCRICLDKLLGRHDRLVKWVVSQQWRGGVPWADLEQEGRIALWQAILGYDVKRGTAFSSYAVVAIQRQVWRVVCVAEREPALLWCEEGQGPSAARLWALAEQRRQVLALVQRLPLRLRRIVVGAYGLDGKPARSLAALGRQQGLSRERIRQLRNDALVYLRLQILAGAETDIDLDRRRYRYLVRLNHTWLGRWRREAWPPAG